MNFPSPTGQSRAGQDLDKRSIDLTPGKTLTLNQLVESPNSPKTQTICIEQPYATMGSSAAVI